MSRLSEYLAALLNVNPYTQEVFACRTGQEVVHLCEAKEINWFITQYDLVHKKEVARYMALAAYPGNGILTCYLDGTGKPHICGFHTDINEFNKRDDFKKIVVTLDL